MYGEARHKYKSSLQFKACSVDQFVTSFSGDFVWYAIPFLFARVGRLEILKLVLSDVRLVNELATRLIRHLRRLAAKLIFISFIAETDEFARD